MKFLMDYDNIPGKGPLMLFKDNGDGTLSLATPDDVENAIKQALDQKDKIIQDLQQQLETERTITDEKRQLALEFANALQAEIANLKVWKEKAGESEREITELKADAEKPNWTDPELKAENESLENLIRIHHDGEFKSAKQVIDLTAKLKIAEECILWFKIHNYDNRTAVGVAQQALSKLREPSN